MVVISDTSIITNLIQLDQLSLLSQLFGNIIIPQKVFDELAKIPGQVEMIGQIDWIEVKAISDKSLFDQIVQNLDPGETEAIVLAIELHADALLIDEKKGRKIAQAHGITITGLLGILVDAREENLIPAVKPVLDRLIFDIGFRISPKLYREILEKVKE